MAEGTVAEIKRKPKRSGLMKQVRKMGSKVTGYILPTLRWVEKKRLNLSYYRSYHGFLVIIYRYTLIPGCLIYAVYFTEPQPSFLELLNPFY